MTNSVPDNLATSQGQPARSSPLAAGHPTSRRLKVLVVEDDLSSRLLLKGLISKYGECQTALNGREAIAAFRSARDSGQSFDLICMDIHMPEMDGQEAVIQIRALESKEGSDIAGAKILMTSASKDVQTILASYSARCDGYLVKPFDGTQLEERLKTLGLIKDFSRNT